MPELERYRRLLEGIAANATKCPVCEMLARLAREALGKISAG
jgi:hypothetical protein